MAKKSTDSTLEKKTTTRKPAAAKTAKAKSSTKASTAKASAMVKVSKTAPEPETANVEAASVKKRAETTQKKPRATKVESDPRTQYRALAAEAAQYALEKKATNVKLIDLTGITSLTDYFVIASADSDKQVKAIAENVIVQMRDNHGQSAWRTEGWDSLQWVIIDFVDFVVHVFHAEARIYYNLERLYSDAPQEMIEDRELKKPKRAARKNITVSSELLEKSGEASDDDGVNDEIDSDKIRVISKRDRIDHV